MDRKIEIPDVIRQAAEQGAALAVSVSGGKDSQALLRLVVQAYKANGWTGQIFAIYADLGRAVWRGSKDWIRRLAEEEGVPVVITKQKDLIDHMRARLATIQAKGENKPFWPSSAARYCTSDTKRDPINSELKAFDLVISVEGIRAQESTNRAKKPVCEVREKITSKRLKTLDPADALAAFNTGTTTKKGKKIGERLAFDWRPILHFSRAEIWEACGTSSFEIGRRRALFAQGDEAAALDNAPVHFAYIAGNERFSCALCILAKENDLRNGAKYHPEILDELISLEDESGFTFRKDFSLRELRS